MSRAIRPSAREKEAAYAEAASQIRAVVAGEADTLARMATVTCLLREALPTYFWTGFYLVDRAKRNELVIGPYQGTLGCLRIPFGQGVCGVAAAARRTQVVPDVHLFPGHIACDARSNSEIVVPVFDRSGDLIAVFDVDSTEYASFDDVDRRHLESILAETFAC